MDNIVDTELPLNITPEHTSVGKQPEVEQNNPVLQPNDVVVPTDETAQAAPEDAKEESVPNAQSTTYLAQPNEQSVPEKLSNKHYKAVKDKAERAERERDELMRMLQEERSRQQQQWPPEPEEDFGINSDDFIEGKQLKGFVKEVRELKKELDQYKQKTALDVTETKLRTEYPDFDKVFTNDNIEVLKEEHPEIAQTLGSSNADPYLVAKSTYKMIKKLGVYQELPEDKYVSDRETVQKNLSKPRPLAAASPRQGEGPLQKANAFGGELTDELKAQLWKEVQEATR